MILITGAYGFIGSCSVSAFGSEAEIIAVDDFSKNPKAKNLEGKNIAHRIERTDLFLALPKWKDQITAVIHLGARTDTTEFDEAIFDELNVSYSKKVWQLCTEYQIPLIYASSAATYGEGEKGYSDSLLPHELQPLNPYGRSKNDFDAWALQETEMPPFWAGLKFFNVYGPNEYHKGRMASTIFHFFNQIKAKDEVNLFQSHRPDFGHGEQKRDFVYVKDVLKVIRFLYENRANGKVASGIYNLGTGTARTFNDLVSNVFLNVGKTPHINYVPTPEDIRNTYQYFTEADMSRLKNQGYEQPFYSLEEGIKDYVNGYLIPQNYF